MGGLKRVQCDQKVKVGLKVGVVESWQEVGPEHRAGPITKDPASPGQQVELDPASREKPLKGSGQAGATLRACRPDCALRAFKAGACAAFLRLDGTVHITAHLSVVTRRRGKNSDFPPTSPIA